MSDAGKTKTETDITTAFHSAMQIIYEQLMLAFGDAVETLHELQAAEKRAERPGEDTDDARDETQALPNLDTREFERAIAAQIDARELPTRRELQRLQRDLQALNAALDERLATHARAEPR